MAKGALAAVQGDGEGASAGAAMRVAQAVAVLTGLRMTSPKAAVSFAEGAYRPDLAPHAKALVLGLVRPIQAVQVGRLFLRVLDDDGSAGRDANAWTWAVEYLTRFPGVPEEAVGPEGWLPAAEEREAYRSYWTAKLGQ